MAKTGVTDIGIRPVVESDVHVYRMPEAASTAVTTPQGALFQNVSGYLTLLSGAVTSAWGFLYNGKAHNGSSNGDYEISLGRLEQGKEYEIQLNGTAAATDTDTTGAITQTSGIPVVAVTGSSADCRIVRLAPGWAIGDINPRVIVVFYDSFIEQSGGNE